jgi:DNA-binding transcriptional LysR family regulator
MRRTGVVYRPLSERSPGIEVGIAWRRGAESPAVRAFVTAARASTAER